MPQQFLISAWSRDRIPTHAVFLFLKLHRFQYLKTKCCLRTTMAKNLFVSRLCSKTSASYIYFSFLDFRVTPQLSFMPVSIFYDHILWMEVEPIRCSETVKKILCRSQYLLIMPIFVHLLFIFFTRWQGLLQKVGGGES